MASDSLFRRLYRGESNMDFIGSRRKWWGVLACGTAVVLLTVSAATADDKTLEEFKKTSSVASE